MNTLFLNILMVIIVIFIFTIIFIVAIFFYKCLSRLFNKIEELITGVKKQDPKNKNLPLKELSKIQTLSLRDTILVYLFGLFPFIGWVFLPKIMRNLNITDYYELRFKSGMERINERENHIKVNSLYRFKSFESVRAYTAILLSYTCILEYFENISHFMEYLSYKGFYSRGTYQKESFSDILLYVKSQLSVPLFDSIFIQSSWLLFLAGIFYYYNRYWSRISRD